MIIANPIYDTVFKNMMENERVVKFFIGTLLEKQIESVVVKPQEFTYKKEMAGIAVFRLDFIATIKTKTGEHKKVLIEIQKARHKSDILRFRNYLGEQYKKQDKVGKEDEVLPITTIYILGFTLPEIKTACVEVKRSYKDRINNTIINKKSHFLECLTHDCFVVQVKRITNRYQTSLDKLLSVFEQNDFVAEDESTKQFIHPTDSEEIKILTDVLHITGTDPEQRKRIETEIEAWRTINALSEGKEQAIKRRDKELLAVKEKLAQKDKALEAKKKALEAKNKAIEAKNKEIEDKEKALEVKNNVIEAQSKAIEIIEKELGDNKNAIKELVNRIAELERNQNKK